MPLYHSLSDLHRCLHAVSGLESSGISLRSRITFRLCGVVGFKGLELKACSLEFQIPGLIGVVIVDKILWMEGS